MTTSLLEQVTTDAWVDQWETLYALTPGTTWQQKKIEKNEGESAYHFTYRLFYSYLVRKAMRVIGQSSYTYDEILLAEVLLHDHLMKAFKSSEKEGGFSLARKYLHYSDEAFKAQVFGMCRRAARWALANFDRATYIEKQEKGRRGGKAFQKWSLDTYLNTRGMSARETAEALDMSVRTVFNMRKHFKELGYE